MNLSRNCLHMSSPAWNAALRRLGWVDILSAANLDRDGAKGVLGSAMDRWSRRYGLGPYRPKGGYVLATLQNATANNRRKR